MRQTAGSLPTARVLHLRLVPLAHWNTRIWLNHKRVLEEKCWGERDIQEAIKTLFTQQGKCLYRQEEAAKQDEERRLQAGLCLRTRDPQ